MIATRTPAWTVRKRRSRRWGAFLLPLLAALFLVASAAAQRSAGIHKFGHNPDVDIASVPEDVWTLGGLYPFPAVTGPLTLVSSSANDTSAGTGCQSMRLIGLTDTFAEITETLPLSGLTPVLSTLTYFRIYRASCSVAGSTSSNVGTISITSPAPATVASIAPGDGQTEMAIYTIPAYGPASIAAWNLNIQAATNTFATVALMARPVGGAWAVQERVQLGRGSIATEAYRVLVYLNVGTDLRWVVESVTTDDTAVSAVFEITQRVSISSP